MQCPAHRRAATEPVSGIPILVAHSHREVHRAYFVIGARSTDSRASRHPVSRGDCDLGEVGIRGPKPSTVCDCYGQHPRHLAGKGHQSRIGGSHLGADRSCDVDAPVSSVAADGSKPVDSRTVNRLRQSGAHPAWGKQTDNDETDDGNFDGILLVPPPSKPYRSDGCKGIPSSTEEKSPA